MNNPFDEMTKALNEAKQLHRAIRSQANDLADLLNDNLDSVSSYRLTKLKTQLRKYNMHTGRWKK